MDDDFILKLRVHEFYDEYASALDEMELDRWAGMFTENARYEVTSRENFDQGLTYATIFCDGLAMIRDRVTAIREALIFEERLLRRFVSSVRLDRVEDDVIFSRANFLVVEAIAEAKPDLTMFGSYVDELRRVGAGFLIQRRQCVVDNYWMPRSVVIPV